MDTFKPSASDLAAAAAKTVPDLVTPGLKILFVGVNPGLYSAAIGHHFGRPGNRFWPSLHAGGLTDRVFSPFEEGELLRIGYGITNIVERATATAKGLTREELEAGARRLEKKVARLQPRIVALLGIEAYRRAFGRPRAVIGRQSEHVAGSLLWVLPNPSGLNAHYQIADLGPLFREVRKEGERPAG